MLNINQFANGKYVSSETFNGTKPQAIEFAKAMLANSYYSCVSVEPKSGLIVAAVRP